MLAQLYINIQELTTLVPPETSLARGSSFANLYIPYKFETNKILKGSTPRQNLLALIDIYSFIVHDLPPDFIGALKKYEKSALFERILA